MLFSISIYLISIFLQFSIHHFTTIENSYVYLSKNYYTFIKIGNPAEGSIFKIDLMQNKTWVTPEGYHPKHSKTNIIESVNENFYVYNTVFFSQIRNDLFNLEFQNITINNFSFYYIKTIDIEKGCLGLSRSFTNYSLSFIHKMKEQGIINKLAFGFANITDKHRMMYFGETKEKSSTYKYKVEIPIDTSYPYWGNQLDYIEINNARYDINKYSVFQTSHGPIFVPKTFFDMIIDKYFSSLFDNGICVLVNKRDITRIECIRDNFEMEITFVFGIKGIIFMFNSQNIFDTFSDTVTFLIQTSDRYRDQWILGNLFFNKYFSVFDYEDKSVSFFSNEPFQYYADNTSNEKNYFKILLMIIIVLNSFLVVYLSLFKFLKL